LHQRNVRVFGFIDFCALGDDLKDVLGFRAPIFFGAGNLCVMDWNFRDRVNKRRRID
jgi:hypothetical protein